MSKIDTIYPPIIYPPIDREDPIPIIKIDNVEWSSNPCNVGQAILLKVSITDTYKIIKDIEYI